MLDLGVADRDAIGVGVAGDAGIVAARAGLGPVTGQRIVADAARVVDAAEDEALLAASRSRRTARDGALRLRIEAAVPAQIVAEADHAAHVLTVVLPGLPVCVCAARARRAQGRTHVFGALVTLRESAATRERNGSQSDKNDQLAHQLTSLVGCWFRRRTVPTEPATPDQSDQASKIIVRWRLSLSLIHI